MGIGVVAISVKNSNSLCSIAVIVAVVIDDIRQLMSCILDGCSCVSLSKARLELAWQYGGVVVGGMEIRSSRFEGLRSKCRNSRSGVEG